jgi:hypothetical protein
MSVSEILKKNQFTVELDGIPFVMRKVQAYMALDALGADAMAMLSDSGEQSPWEKLNYKKQLAFMKSYLRVAMVSPALRDKTDEKNDTISFDDLGTYSNDLFGSLMEEVNSDAEVFPESSEEQEE